MRAPGTPFGLRTRRASCLALTSCALSFMASTHAAGDARRPVTLADLESLSFPDVTMQFSPDGGTLSYSLSSDSLWLVRARAGARPRQIGSGFLPGWSAAGDELAFYSLGSGDVQLWIYDLKSGTARQLTHVPGGIDPDPATRIVGFVHDAFRYTWSPDGRQLVFASRVAAATQRAAATAAAPKVPEPTSSATPLILTPTTPPDWTLSGLFAHPRASFGTLQSKDGHSITSKRNDAPGVVLSNQLFVVSVQSGVVRRLTRDDRNYFNPQWSADGQSIVAAATGASGPIFGSAGIGIVSISLDGNRVQALSRGSGVSSRPSWAPDGRQLAYFDSETFVGRPAVRVEKAGVALPRDVTAALDRQVDDFVWSDDSQAIFVSYQDGLSEALARIALPAATVENLIPAGDHELPVDVSGLTASRAGALAWVQEDPMHPSSIQLLAPGAARPITLVDLQPQTRHWRLGTVKVIHWRNSRGEERDGTLLRPPGFSPGRRYPLIVDAYPLTGGADWTYPMMGNQAWASAGYLVFRPSPRAPHVWMNPWKSEASSLVAKGPKGWDVTLDDVMSGVDEVIRRGYADPARMCLYGFSNGGGVVNYLVTRTNRFRCAVSVAGALSDWVRPALLETGYDALLAQWAGVELSEDPDAYVQLSAVFHLSHVKTPMLLADGDNDGDFLLDTIEMYNGLRSAGVDVTLLRYPDQGHGFTGPAMADFWKREMAFFNAHLRVSLPTPPPTG
jgi:dipeptidyl aminopeptidase/acylaminoacyl peptidase